MPPVSQRQQAAQCYNQECPSGGKEVQIPLGRQVAANIWERLSTRLFCGDCGGDLIPYDHANPLVPTPPPPPPKPPKPEPPKPFVPPQPEEIIEE